MLRRLVLLLCCSGLSFLAASAWKQPVNAQTVQSPSTTIWQRDQLVAWCVVPFDAKKRGPEERAAMLAGLGIRRLAYDYRSEHVPTFDAEMEALKRHGIELTAWWFPTDMNDEAKLILDVLKRHDIKTQLWVTGGGGPVSSEAEQQARVASEAARIGRIAKAAAEIDCQVALYNHGGWFGDPENQIAIIKALDMPNVGIVYNLHHGHPHLDRFAELLDMMKPYLLALNLNGMIPRGDELGQKIVPIGGGSEDPKWLKAIQSSGYRGPIGILNHTDHDAELRLLDNLEGLEFLLKRQAGEEGAVQPEFRTWQPPTNDLSLQLFPGKLLPGQALLQQPPLIADARVRLTDTETFNILVAVDRKDSPLHWEVFTWPTTGTITAYFPGRQPDHLHTSVSITDGKWHDIQFLYEPHRARLFVDGQRVGDIALEGTPVPANPSGIGIGRLVEGGLGFHGEIESVQLRAVQGEERQTLVSWPANEPLESRIPASTTKETESAPGDTQAAAVYDPARVQALIEQAQKEGDPVAGIAVFGSNKFACLSCHKVSDLGGSVGPALDKIAVQREMSHIVESILWPQRTIEPAFQTTRVLTETGSIVTGYVVAESEEQVTLRDPSTGMLVELAGDTIEDMRPAGSLMPDGLTDAMRLQQQLDLIALLSDLGKWDRVQPEMLQSVLSHFATSEPATFEYALAPLDPENWTQLHQGINQNRLYQYYAKQAEHFRKETIPPPLLAEFPGLDGPNFGHWGNQNEAGWADDRWNQTVLGRVQCGIFSGADKQVPRGICVRLGDAAEMSTCFDPQTLSYPAVWTGGFLKFSSVRHGFMHGVLLDGEPLDTSGMASTRSLSENQDFEYHGYYRHGERVVFAYRIGNVEYLDSPWCENGQFVRHVAPRDDHPLNSLVQGGPAQWPQVLPTKIELGQQSPYALDTIAIPSDNPWQSLIFIGDHDFLANGDVVVCTMQGDVWRVSGLNDATTTGTSQAKWRRIAAGLNQALGLVVVEDQIYVLGRDQITRLHDLNRDGEMDFYESFCRAYETSSSGHDFICGLQRDANGYFYTASGNQGLLRISPDGKRAEVIADGFRNPDGLGMLPDGTVTVPCSEGEWTPASMICAIRPGQENNFFGYRGPRDKQPPALPMVYLPRGVDNSSGGQVFIDSDRWGPLQGQMIHTSYGAGTYMLLLRNEVDGVLQGGVVPLPGDFASAIHRARFSPHDGQLYVSGMAGWGTYTTDDGSFTRIRYTGGRVQQPIGFHLHENGIMLRFSADLDVNVAANAREHFAQVWNYRYSSAYGSPEYSTKHAGVRGHDTLRITAAHVLPDKRSLFLVIPDLQPVNQVHLRVYASADEPRDLFLTAHRLDRPFSDYPGYRAESKKIDPHPIFADMAMATESVPNPWRQTIDGARKVRVVTASNLSYETRSLRVKAGEALQLTLVNPDVVPHNWVLVQPGSEKRVGELANRLIADPLGVVRHYVPESEDVIVYTDVVEPKKEMAIHFRAPEKPGRYPYMCTFPGHWMVMVGELIVE